VLNRPHGLLFCAGLLLLCLLTSISAEASGVGPADVTRWSDAWNSHNIDRVTALFSPNTVVDEPANPAPLNYKTLRPFFRMIFTAYPDFHIHVEDAVTDGWKAVTIERVTGHWLGAYTNPATGKTNKPNGHAFDHPGAMYIVYGSDHKIKLLRIFWDRVVVDQQLGLTP